MASETLLKAIAVTAELLGLTMSKDAARVLASDLARYPEPQVLGALDKCRREVKGRLTPAEIISRLDDGRPGAEEAWAQIPRDESQTVVWCQEAAEAFGVALPLIQEGDNLAARMAFREAYNSRVAQAREQGTQVRWIVSLGHDIAQRRTAIEQAVALGRLAPGYAAAVLPAPDVPRLGHHAIEGALRMIASEAKKQANPAELLKIKGHIKGLRDALRGSNPESESTRSPGDADSAAKGA